MKFTHKLILLALGGAMVAPMYIKGPNGKPLMTLDDWIPKDAIAVLDATTESAGEVVSGSGKQTFYKWKDADGVWQMTQNPPSGLDPSLIEERTIYANANIIKSLDSSEISNALGASISEKVKGKFAYNPEAPEDLMEGMDEDKGFSLSTVPIKKIPDLINQAQNIGTSMNARNEALQQL